MAKKYDVPEWAATSEESFSLEVLKNGSIIDNIELSGKDHFVFGRQPDICDFLLDHESISRQHAVLQFKNDGSLQLYDLGSSLGTFLNKNRCPQRQYVRVFVGDIIKFAGSTRQYLVCGPSNQMPEEYDSANMQKYRQKLSERTILMEKKREEESSLGISWGFADDAPPEDWEEEESEKRSHIEEEKEKKLPAYVKNDPNYDRKYGESFSASLVESEIVDKDREIYEKIKAKEKKIQNMQEEIRRIYMKEKKQEGELTEGQQAAVQRNDQRIEVLKNEIEELEMKIRTNNKYRESGQGPRSAHGKSARDADNDDVIDETNVTAADASTNWRLKRRLSKKSSHSVVQTQRNQTHAYSYEELCAESQEVQLKLNELSQEICTLNEVISKGIAVPSAHAESPSNSGEKDGDAMTLDDVLLDLNRREAVAKKQRLEQQLRDNMTRFGTVNKLLKIATPAIIYRKAEITSDPSARTPAPPPPLPSVNHLGVFIEQGNASSLKSDVIPEINSEDLRPDDAQRFDNLTCPVAVTCQSVMSLAVSETSLDSQGADTTLGETTLSDTTFSVEMRAGVSGTSVRKETKRTSEERHTVGNSMSLSVTVQQLANTNKRKRDSVLGPSRPHPNALNPQQIFRPNVATLAPAPVLPSAGDMLEGGESTWVPPKNQSGDGRTALNLKYGY